MTNLFIFPTIQIRIEIFLCKNETFEASHVRTKILNDSSRQFCYPAFVNFLQYFKITVFKLNNRSYSFLQHL